MKYLILICFAFVLLSGCEKDPTPENSVPNVTTGDLCFCGNVSAILDVYNSFICSTDSNINLSSVNCGTRQSALYGSYERTCIAGLASNTTYYFREYSKDIYDNIVWGDVKSFTTMDTAAAVTTVKLYWNSTKATLYVHASLIGIDKIAEWGTAASVNADMSDCEINAFSLTEPYIEGTVETMGWNVKYFGTFYFCTYAKLTDGSYIVGDVKSIDISK